MPELYIITGSNGAGKSSVGPVYLPKYIQKNYTVFDGDKLFMHK
jgi:predicted ABC-type ATPase